MELCMKIDKVEDTLVAKMCTFRAEIYLGTESIFVHTLSDGKVVNWEGKNTIKQHRDVK